MDYLSSPLGCARRNPPDVARSRGAYYLVKDERLRRCVILGSSATVGIRAIMSLRVSSLFFKPKIYPIKVLRKVGCNKIM